jgi:hypothetical protein
MPAYFDPRPIGRRQRARSDQEMLVRHFNALHPVGSKVRIWPMARGSEPCRETEVVEPGAYVNSAGSAVVKVPGDSIALTHVEAMQP